jgi:hypothetical protein
VRTFERDHLPASFLLLPLRAALARYTALRYHEIESQPERRREAILERTFQTEWVGGGA